MAILPLEVDFEELKMHTVNPKATPNTEKQKFITNEFMKQKNQIIKMLNLSNKRLKGGNSKNESQWNK